MPDLDLGPDDGSPAPWEGLKGDAQAIVSAQILRLERFMTHVRGWSVATITRAWGVSSRGVIAAGAGGF